MAQLNDTPARGGAAILNNPDLSPTAPQDRRWGAWSFAAVWMGIAHNVNQWILVAAMLAAGMSIWQAGAAVIISFGVVYVAIILNGTIGARHGLAFPPLARAIFGEWGAYIPIILRSLSGVAQLGVFVYVTGEGIATTLRAAIPGFAGFDSVSIVGMTGTNAVGYVIAFVLHLWIVTHGIERVRKFELIAGPLIMALAIGLFIWAVVVAGGFEPIASMPSTVHGTEFWGLFFLSVAGLIGSMSSLVVNNPDIARFAKSQKSQLLGQGIGVPIMFAVFSAVTIVATAGTKFAFGHIIQDPIKIFGEFGNPIIVVIGSLVIASSTLSLNAATNAVAAGFDFAALFPRYLNFRRATTIALVVGLLAVPWLWYGIGQFTTLFYGFLGVVMGPIFGIMIADYYVIRHRRINIAALYETTGIYSYRNGWNYSALAALVIGTVAAGCGAVIPGLSVLYQFNWFVGVIVGGLIYLILMWPSRSILVDEPESSGAKITDPAGGNAREHVG
jgi:NCS1 family nucleobase:cation symporter-1